MITTLDYYITQWEIRRDDYSDVVTLMKKKSFKQILAHLKPILTSLYYYFVNEITSTLTDELDKELRYIDLLNFMIMLSFLASFFIIYVQVVQRVWTLMRNFLCIVFVLPVNLVEKNLVMKHHLKKVTKGSSLYKF